MEAQFELVAPYGPAGDQPAAIDKLVGGIFSNKKHQVLQGVTGSGKTFTIANVIAKVGKPTIVISHNKTLAAQLYAEFKNFFPHNAVEYFVSYFDYYQPEAYIPETDTYIEKDASRNSEIERLRLSTMSSLFTRRDVIVVASVSCIYGIGSPEDYQEMVVELQVGQEVCRQELLRRLVDLQYMRNDVSLERGTFRARGDTIELVPAYSENALRIELFGDQVEKLTWFDPLTGRRLGTHEAAIIHPAAQFVTPHDKIKRAILSIRQELEERIAWFEAQGKLIEAQRIKMRTEYDLEMLESMGYCPGIENYSRHLSGRAPGSRPYTILDFFPKDYLMIIDESHATVPQIRGMYNGDISRKKVLVEHGFRLPSALDNRPLSFQEFQSLQGQTIYVSATPGKLELEWACQDAIGHIPPDVLPSIYAPTPGSSPPPGVVELIVRPTGLVDPPVTVKPLQGQVDDLIEECRRRAERHERVLVTTLTKRTAEELTDYLMGIGINVRYLHSEIDAIERVEILRALRKGDFDVLVGINLLREGLDLPEVSLVAILDADKEGFLRSTTSLIQTAGRAARHINGEVILYADVITNSIREFLMTTEYRRQKQLAYNEKHNITPRSVTRAVEESLSTRRQTIETAETLLREVGADFDLTETIRELEAEMLEASNNLEFEKAALIRDQIRELKRQFGLADHSASATTKTSSRQPRKYQARQSRTRAK